MLWQEGKLIATCPKCHENVYDFSNVLQWDHESLVFESHDSF
jgi:hypothetical protein